MGVPGYQHWRGPMAVVVTASLVVSGCSSMQIQAVLTCGLIGGAIGAAVGQGKKAVYAGAGLSAAVCLAIATEMDNRRREALAKERELDRRIATKARAADDLEWENRGLRAELENMRRLRAQLERTRDDGSEQRARARAQLNTDAVSASERLKVVEDRIRLVDEGLRNPKLDAPTRDALVRLRANLIDRRSILREMATLA